MFGPRYFGRRHFGARYFAAGGTIVVVGETLRGVTVSIATATVDVEISG